ncbi:hypothetical protein PG984_009921 [Apiospora sp. TS-2023a]
MPSLKFLLATALATAAGVLGAPSLSLALRQFDEIPPNSLYLIQWYPRGCGNGGDVEQLTGGEETLAACSKFNGLSDPDPAVAAAVNFMFPDDGRVFKWRLFSSNDCADQIAQGEGGQCFSVPVGQSVGAVIVYT